MDEEIEECDHIWEEPHYICKLCGYDLQGLAIDEAYEGIENEEDYRIISD